MLFSKATRNYKLQSLKCKAIRSSTLDKERNKICGMVLSDNVQIKDMKKLVLCFIKQNC